MKPDTIEKGENMQQFNFRKIKMIGALIGIMTSLMFVFQNFVPYEPFTGHDGRDLYLNGALTDALEDAEKEQQASKVALNVQEREEEARKPLKKHRKVSSIDGADEIVKQSEPLGDQPTLTEEQEAEKLAE